jgi:hypothetical protein
MNTSIFRGARTKPATADEVARTVELTIATDAVIGGTVLSCAADAVTHSAAPVPVLLGHMNQTSRMAGRLLSIRADVQRQANGAEIVKRWRLAEASLTPAGADPAATTRSLETTHPQESPTMDNSTSNNDTASATIERSAREIKLERDCLQIARAGQLSNEQTEKVVAEGLARGLAAASCMATSLVVERIAATPAPATAAAAGGAAAPRSAGLALEEVLYRALSGRQPLQVPLWRMLIEYGLSDGARPSDVIRRALFGHRLLQRGGLSTSDLPELLTTAGDRALLERFAEAPQGIRAIARMRPLADFRPATVIDLGMVGTAEKMQEGGEVRYGSINEAANSYRAYRHALGLKFTAEAIANDDLAGLEEAIAEMGDACLSAEADALTDLLEGAADGRIAVDGKALFHADHLNRLTSGGLSVAVFGDAVELLRTQKNQGGRPIAQAPATVLCAPGLETAVRAFLSNDWQPETYENAQPWRGVAVEVEPRLSGTYYYVVSDSSRRPLQLGRQSDGPLMTSETDFDTDAYKVKVVHSFGSIVSEHRTIVRIQASA